MGKTPTKVCPKCGKRKSLSEFHSRGGRQKSLLKSRCKDCSREEARIRVHKWNQNNAIEHRRKVKQWRLNNPDKKRAMDAQYRAKNRDTLKVRKNTWYLANKHLIRSKRAAYGKLWQQRNKGRVVHYVRLRQIRKLQATPPWVNLKQIETVYELAAFLCKKTGNDYHVDHVVPLQSSIVCGLHCPANLRIILRSENQSKGNKTWPDMPMLTPTEIRQMIYEMI